MKFLFTSFILTVLISVSVCTFVFGQTNWTKDPNNPVMSGGASGTWNRHVFMPSVLYNTDSLRYEMWFTASTSVGIRPFRIGFATSPDGITWTKHPNPVLESNAGTWDESTVEFPMVIRENGEYKMWYSGFDPISPNLLGYATSPDGINWTKDTRNNPVMGPGTASWEAGGPIYCTIVSIQGGGYKMWYCGWNQQYDSLAIGYAESVDGISWQRPLNNPVLTTGSLGEWDDRYVSMPRVLFIDEFFYMWYTGFQNEFLREVGLATSPDGITWTKYDDPTKTSPPYAESDPVLSPSPEEWDGTYISNATFMLIGDTLHTWYSGSRSPIATHLWRIGHATTSIVTALEEIDSRSYPSEFVLKQNYPNPFNPKTVISYKLKVKSDVDLSIFNILGQKVATLVNKNQPAGRYQVQWNASGFSSGIYYYCLKTAKYRQTRKLVLLK